MASAVKIKKIIEVKLNDTLELVEEIVDCMPCNVYFLSKAKGVLKFARTEEACNAYLAEQKAKADAKAAKKAEEAAKKAAEEDTSENPVEEAEVENPVEETEVENPVEETETENPVEETETENPVEETKAEDPAEQLATKYELTEVNPPIVPRYFVNAAGEQFMWLPKSGCFISFAPMTDESGKAHRGKAPVISKRSPKRYEELAASVGATIPTKEQIVEFAAILVGATSAANVAGVKAVIPDVRLNNQLCTEGTVYTTLLGEQSNLLPTFSIFNLECRKVLA